MMIIKSFITHKRGKTTDSIQDSIAIDAKSGRFALSDGVTDSFLPEIWADVLTHSFVSICDINDFSPQALQPIFISRKESYIPTLNAEARYILKLSEKHYHTGAATFVGVELKDSVLNWRLIGDSCLFIIPNGEPIQCICSNAVIINDSGQIKVDFNNYPFQVHSDGTIYGEWINGEMAFSNGYVVMMSDAMSAWFINQYNLGNNPIAQIECLNGNEDFENFVEDQYQKELLASDDESVILIKVNDCNESTEFKETENNQKGDSIYSNNFVESEGSEPSKKETFWNRIKRKMKSVFVDF